MTANPRPFHLAFPVRDIEQARDFYVGTLGCGVGRSDERWIDFDFFGHQVVAHLVAGDHVLHQSQRQCHGIQKLQGPFLAVRHVTLPETGRRR